jgi:hypothetical protein
MSISIWWAPAAFMAGLWAGVFVICACRKFSEFDHSGHF